MIECKKLPDGSFEMSLEGHSADVQVEAGVLLANMAEDLGRLVCFKHKTLTHEEGEHIVLQCILGVAHERLNQKRMMRKKLS